MIGVCRNGISSGGCSLGSHRDVAVPFCGVAVGCCGQFVPRSASAGSEELWSTPVTPPVHSL